MSRGRGIQSPLYDDEMVQHISPAFRIDSNVGVSAVADDEMIVTVSDGMVVVSGKEECK